MKRIIRERPLTPDEAAKYREIREQVDLELPELIARHDQRMAVLEKLDELLRQLKAAREQRGMSLADVSERAGVDHSILLSLESDARSSPTVETLLRYADAVGMNLEISLINAAS